MVDDAALRSKLEAAMSPRLCRILAVLLLGLFTWLALGQSGRVGLTFDEPAHLAAGRAYNATGDFRLHAENGLWPQRWAALVSPWAETRPPDFAGPAWERGDVWGAAREWLFAPGQDTPAIVLSARAQITLLALALLVVIWRWSAALWGERGGLLSLAIAACCPHLLAHGSLVTSDTAAALGFAVALLAWWRLLHRITPGRVLAAGAATTFVATAKFSGVLLAPAVLGLLLVRLFRGGNLVVVLGGRIRRERGMRKAASLGGAVLATAVVSWVGVWAGYGFRFAATADGREARFAQDWDEVLLTKPRTGGSVMADGSRPDTVEMRPGLVQRFVSFARGHHLLPEAWLYGLAFTDRFSRHRLAYFAGEVRESGWTAFFPAAFVLKTPLPLLALALLAALAVARHRRWAHVLYRIAPLGIFAAIYTAVALTSSLNIGHRHLLPLYPLLYIFSGAAFSSARDRLGLALVLSLAGWQALETLRARPHYLTYFNALAGGPQGGHRFLVDSSLDWGQGLPELKQWLDEHAIGEVVHLSYFGSDDPRHAGILATRIGDAYFDHAPDRPILPAMQPGLYAVGATMLHRVYTQVRGPWSESYEEEYRRLLLWWTEQEGLPPTQRRDASGRPLDDAGYAMELHRLEQLRFGRLCRWLERRPADAVVANVFFVHRLSAEDLRQALFAPLAD